MTELSDLLERLSNEFGPSGQERKVRTLIREEISPHVDRVEVDALGNLLAYKQGTGPEPRLRVMLSAHMDEVGFMVTRIEKGGHLRLRLVGSIDKRVLLAKRVLIGEAQIPGVICSPPPHLQSAEQRVKVLDADTLAIDVGASSEKEAGAKVKVGDYGVLASRYVTLSADPRWPTVRGKAFDDRAGCSALISILGSSYPVDLIAAFTVQEEVGLRGARVAAYRAAPEAAFALEGTICDDTPAPEDEDRTAVTRMGDGPALTLMDRSVVSHPGMTRLLEAAAEAQGIKIQYKAPGLGSTDSGAIHLTRAGVPASVIGIPCRYIHSPASILNLDDLANTARLVAAALELISQQDLVRQG